MREIKFRAWDKRLKEMDLPFIFADITAYGQLMANNTDLERLSDYELMQYTGLKDKNGKEIYEGDIVKSGQQSLPWFVGWEESLTATDRMDDEYEVGSGFNVGKQDAKYCEVIGNIYENPELLNGDQPNG